MPEHRAFFGDAERTFALTAPTIRELERIRNASIGTLTNRIFAREFFHDDLIEVLRLALVGGGTSPQEAMALINAYAIGRPIFETQALAVEILGKLWNGELKPDSDTEEKGDDHVDE